MKKSLLLIIALAFVAFSCENLDGDINKSLDETTDALAQEDNLVEETINDLYTETDAVVNELDDVGYTAGLLKSTNDVCKTITIDYPDSTRFPKVITIDYGEVGCEGTDGKVRSGKVIVTVTGRYRFEGTQRIIEFEDFYVDSNKIEGTKTVTNKGMNGEYMEFSILIENFAITFSDGIQVTRNSERTRRWLMSSYFNKKQKDWYVTGYSEGINYQGLSFTREITTELHASNQCRWMMSGVVETVFEDGTIVVIDYGDDTCDNLATVTKNGEEYEIELKGKRNWRRLF